MKIRTSFLKQENEIELGSQIIIMADENRPLYYISLQKDGKTLEISCSMTCRINGELLDNELIISPNSQGSIYISRKVWE